MSNDVVGNGQGRRKITSVAQMQIRNWWTSNASLTIFPPSSYSCYYSLLISVLPPLNFYFILFFLQRDTSSPLLSASTSGLDSQWAIRVSWYHFSRTLLRIKENQVCCLNLSFFCLSQPDEKGKFEAIFESLSPLNGLLPGDKVRPVLVNSKLPLDVLGKVVLHVEVM